METGIALASGAAFGAAHAGVLLAVEEAGLDVQLVAGCSAGALVGGVWAAGLPAAEIVDRLLVTGWPDFATVRPSRRCGLLDTAPLRANLVETVGDALIEDLPIRFGAVVTSLVDVRPHVVTTGPLVDALLASSAVPGLFPPVAVDGRSAVDGGVLLPRPARAAREMGARHVVSVVFGRGPRWRRWFESRLYSQEDGGDAAVVIDTAGLSHWSNADVPALIDLGRRAGEAAISARGSAGLLRAV